MTTRTTIRRSTAALCAVGVAALAIVGAGAATVIDRFRYSGTSGFSADGCGPVYDVAGTYSGTYKMRVTADGEGFPEQLNYAWRDVWTNRDTKKSFVVWGNGMWHDIKAEQIGTSTVYRFTVVDAGQQFVIEDMNGRVVSRDRGSIRVDYLWDTLGDGQPGGVFLGDDAVRINGPHPADAEGFPFCDIAAGLTAAG
ncbi:MAG: hypothetical protein ACRC50_01680 [Gaiella sp.]